MLNSQQLLQEYNQRMILQFQDKINDGVLEIKDNQEITNLDFIKNLHVIKLTLVECYSIEHYIANNMITELHIDKCGFQNVLGLQLNNLEILSLKYNYMELNTQQTRNMLIQMQNNSQFSKLKQLDLSELSVINWAYTDMQLQGKIESLSFHKSLTNLVKLTLIGNRITDIDVLSTLINLEELDISRNKGININPIKYLTKLTKLSLERCELMNIQDISNLTRLIYLNLNENSGIDISPLNHLTQLVHLDLFFCGLIDISPLQNLIKLDYLQLNLNSVNVKSLSSLINLVNLNISTNNVDDIIPLQYLDHLIILDISGNIIKDFSILQKFINLEELDMSQNSNADITPLQYLVKLRKLKLQKCGLFDISALRPLINMQKLIINNNIIYDISPLSSLYNLIELHLKDNQITNFSSLEQHSNFNQFQIEDEMTCQYKPDIEEYNIYDKIQRIDLSTILLQNMSKQRKQINTRVNQMTKLICLQNLYSNCLKFSSNIISVFKQLDIGESCQ
ncbi:leucine-rich_repeat domain-containing protein [Hexamita inflata]|uniref:Leucine-rich repeat domain-containing protein n=1 Tax=Hexamita inflata TaxID=28002 RepID=A0AA86QAU3_9EUKA|nr:leucine-rich repeat domain-containing protein [Hexamita inflata]